MTISYEKKYLTSMFLVIFNAFTSNSNTFSGHRVMHLCNTLIAKTQVETIRPSILSLTLLKESGTGIVAGILSSSLVAMVAMRSFPGIGFAFACSIGFWNSCVPTAMQNLRFPPF